MADRVRRKWCVAPRLNPRARLRLFCFPYAGGSASIYHLWHKRLPSEIEILPIQLPGRADRIQEELFRRIPDLVPVVSRELLPELGRPFAFFGHSLGAILCFEVARQLRRSGKVLPKCLFVSGRRAPQIPDSDPPCYSKSDADFLTDIDELKGTSPEVRNNAELMQLLLPVLRADFELVETYEYVQEPPLACPIVAFGGTDDEETSGGMLQAWQGQTSNTFTLHALEGGHFFIHSREDDLLQLLYAELRALRL